MLFTEFSLDERLQRALTAAGFESPTPIQAAALPVALAGRDLVGTAQTGTGKTAAFVLPILQQIIETPSDRRHTRAVILAPTRELVEQILAVVRNLGCQSDIRAAAVYGGVSMRQQLRALRSGAEIIIACPGRLLDHMRRGNAHFYHLKYLVLDEADRMLDMGFMPDIQDIISNLPVERQTMLFSATFAKALNAFVHETLRNPVRVEVDTAVPAQTVRHSMYKAKSSKKMSLLTALLRKLIPESDSVLIFTRTRETANQVTAHLHAEGMPVDVLHAEKTQRERQDTMEQFRRGTVSYLVATDIAARGIDVRCISHVINYDIPATAEDYLHRIGRTGRMECAGQAISLVTNSDSRTLSAIERMLGKRIKVEELDGFTDPEVIKMKSAPHHAVSRVDRPDRKRSGDAPERGEHPRRSSRQDAAPAASQHPGRQKKRRDSEGFIPSDRSKRTRTIDTPITAPVRHKRAHPDNEDATSTRRPMPRPDRPDRRRAGGEANSVPSTRRDRQVRDRFTGRDTAEMPSQERSGKWFTGRGSVARHHKKFGAKKRQPGEVASTPRPTPVQRAHSPGRKKQSSGRRR